MAQDGLAQRFGGGQLRLNFVLDVIVSQNSIGEPRNAPLTEPQP
jgi:hypothetical protein